MTTHNVTVDASGVALTAEERATMFAGGVDAIQQPGGVTYFANGTASGTLLSPGPDIRVNTATIGIQSHQQTTALANGAFVVTWHDSSQGVGGAIGDSSGWAVKAQVFAANGAPVSTEILVNSAVFSSQVNPRITALNNGGFVITWEDSSNGVGGTPGDASFGAIKAQVFTASGTPAGTEVLVNTATQGYQVGPEIVALSNGGFVVTWSDLSQGVGGATGDSSGIAVKLQVFSDNGTAVGTEILVNSNWIWDQYNPKITAIDNGGFVVSWTDSSGDGSGDSVKARVFAPNGTPVSSEILVNTAVSNYQVNQKLTALVNGGFVVTWTDYSQGVGGATGDSSSSAIKAQVFGASGAPMGSEILVNSAVYGGQHGSQIVALSNGNFVMTWNDDSAGIGGTSGDASSRAIKAQLFTGSGAPVGTEILVNTATNQLQENPEITALSDGGFVVTWEDNSQGVGGATGDSSGYAVKAQMFSANGAPVGAEILVNTFTPGDQRSPKITALADGAFVVTWLSQGQDGSASGVYSKVFTSSLDYHVLTSSADTVAGTSADTLVVTAPGDLGAGDSLAGGEGADTIELSASGTLDLTAPAALSGFETILGASGNDTFIANAARLAGISLIDGRQGADALQLTSGGTIDLTGKTLAGIEAIRLVDGNGSSMITTDKAIALLVEAATGVNDSVTLTGAAFSNAEIAQLYAAGVETVIDSAGTHVSNTAPTVTSIVTTDPTLTNSGVVHYTVTFSESVTGVDASQFSLATTGTISGASIASVVPVEGSNGTQYAVAVNTGLGDGAVNLSYSGAGGVLQYSGQVPVSANAFVTTADVNNDGFMDILSANAAARTVSVLLGDATGVFTALAPVEVGQSPTYLAVGDFNGDQNIDLVVSQYTAPGVVRVFSGAGDGTFMLSQTIDTPKVYPQPLVIADITNDGIDDIIVGHTAASLGISVLQGSLSGQFTIAQQLLSNGDPVQLAVGDLNGDGFLDVASASAGENIDLYFGSATGELSHAVAIPGEGFVYSIGIADMNADGKADLVYTGVLGNNLNVLLGDGSGGFTAQPGVATAAGPHVMILADVDADGLADALVSTGAGLQYFRNAGGGVLSLMDTLPVGAGQLASTADFNGDGRLDAVVGNSLILNQPTTITSPTYTIDRTAPTPVISSVDGLMNQATQTITGTGEAGTTVRVLEGTTVLGTTTVAADGTWSTSITLSGVGNYTLTATNTDAAGNVGVSAPVMVLYDNAPVAMADFGTATEEGGIGNAAAGINATGNVLANDSDPDFGDSVTLSNSLVGQPIVGSHGTLTFAADGSYVYVVNNADPAVEALRTPADTLSDVFSYSIVDSFGVSATSTLTITINGTNDGPVAVADSAIAVAAGVAAGFNPTGNVLANDLDVDAGDTKTVVGFTAPAGTRGSLSLNADGSYTYSVNNADAAVQALRTAADTLTDTFSYTMRDAAGALSTTTLAVTIQGANDAPVAVADFGTSGENEIKSFNVIANDFDVDAGDAWTLTSLGAITVASSNVAVNGINAANAFSIVNGQIRLVPGTLFDKLAVGETATITVPYTITDLAGATGTTVLTVTVTGASDRPVISTTITPDTGVRATDRITKAEVVTIKGTSDSGAVLNIYDGATKIGTTTADGLGNWSADLASLADSAHALSARLVVGGKETALATAALTVTVDRSAPVLSALTQVLTADTGVTGDGITSNGAVRVTGTVSDNMAGATVAIWDAATNLRLGTATVTNGNWTYATTLVAGDHQLYAVATDVAGNSVTSALQPAIVVDTTGPAIAILSQVLAADTGVSRTDRITNDGRVSLIGSFSDNRPGATVAVWDAATSSKIGDAVLGSNGQWSFETVLTAGQHSLYAVATDVAGNTRTSAVQRTILVDNAGPTVSITSQLLTSDTGVSGSDNITSNGAVTLAGTVADDQAGATVAIWDHITGVKLGNATVSGNTWTFAGTLAAGDHELYAVAADKAGNAVESVHQAKVTVDKVAQAPAFIGMTFDAAGALVLHGTGEVGSAIFLHDNGATTPFATTTVGTSGDWQMEADLTAVVHSLTLKTTDVAGNAANGSSRAVIGTEGADNLAGSTGNDITFGSGGNDRMTGGAGGDVFVFRVGFGNDVITDFTVTNAPGVLHDTLAFDHNVFADIAAVMSHSAQVGANVVISLDANNSITLQNVALSTLSTQIDDFFFF